MHLEVRDEINDFSQHARRGWPIVSTSELARLYFKERLTVKEVGNRVGLDGSAVRARLNKAGYRLRTKTENAALPAKTMDAIISMYFSDMMSCTEISRNLSLDAEKIRRAIRSTGRELRDKVAARSVRAWSMPSIERRLTYGGASRMLKYSATKERTAPFRKNMPPSERALLTMLESRKVPQLIQQKSISIYNVDFATGSVAIEIVGGRRKCAYFASSAERIYFILKSGFHLIEVMYGEPLDPLKDSAGDEVVAFIERTKLLPPSIREYRMIGGSGQLLAIFKVDLNDSP